MSGPSTGRSVRAALRPPQAPDVPARPAGTRTIPGPRTHAGRPVLPVPAPAAPAPAPRRHPVLRHPAFSAVTAGAGLALVGCAAMILHLVRRQTGTTGLFVGLGLALLPLPFVLGSLAWLNQTARVPLRHLLFCLAWGTSAATTVALLANGWASDFLVAHQGLPGETLGADFATPLIEEAAKGAALLLLLLPPLRRRLRCHPARTRPARTRPARPRRGGDGPTLPHGAARPRGYARVPAVVHARTHLGLRPYPRPLPYPRAHPRVRAHPRTRSRPRTLAAGIVLGGVTACGFAFTENALYLGRAFSGDQRQRLDGIGLGGRPTLRDFDDTIQTFVLRGLLSPFAHPLFTALTGLGLAVCLTSGRRWTARLAAPGGLALAMALHGTWNAAAALGTHGFLLVYGTLMVPSFAALVSFGVWAHCRVGHRPATGTGRRYRACAPPATAAAPAPAPGIGRAPA